ncbi:MAG: HAMP domain-containing protein [Chitinophagaceae bacterium]|nr:MAG: HAMP domain-containing protein [Chitinophagaceae bacterium]
MTLKYRFSLYFSFSLSLLLGIMTLVIISLFADFREDEFQNRLSEKATTALNLLVEVDEVDSALLAKIDQKSSGKLFEENLQIYNEALVLLYHTGPVVAIPFTDSELASLKQNGQIFRHKENDVLGLYRSFGKDGYFVFHSAKDVYGFRKLHFLQTILGGSYLLMVILVGLLSFYLSQITLRSLSKVTQQIQQVNTENLKIDLNRLHQDDEIKALASSFNRMMERIDDVYRSQKEFSSNAAHELRTPIARMTVQLQNLARAYQTAQDARGTINDVLEDAHRLSDIVTSLLLLSKVEYRGERPSFIPVRIDEVLFAARSRLLATNPDFRFQFAIENNSQVETDVEIPGDETLLEIAFQNLFRNAYAYSDDQQVGCLVTQTKDGLEIRISNNGEIPQGDDLQQLFSTFYRGTNTQGKTGSGIGLSIVQRIIHLHGGTVSYETPDAHTNVILVFFQSFNH